MSAPTGPKLRVARHCRDPFALAAQYVDGLRLRELGRFRDHDGYDGVMLGPERADWHLEFLSAPHPRDAAPEAEDALVVYLADAGAWRAAVADALAAGFVRVEAENPYWRSRAESLDDAEGFRLVLVRGDWPA